MAMTRISFGLKADNIGLSCVGKSIRATVCLGLDHNIQTTIVRQIISRDAVVHATALLSVRGFDG